MRKLDWVQKLDSSVEIVRDIPYRAGIHDCALCMAWIADRICVNTNYVARVKMLYQRRRSVLKEIFQSGKDLEILVSEVVGLPMLSMAHLRRGDAVLVKLPDRHLIAVSLGDLLASPGEEGLIFYPCDLGIGGWRID